jgi:G:T-mismatch repair DNA endonuclease (very short patch repair protein)
MFGDYWNKGEDPEDRKNIFKEFGYETLVIWECELKNIDMVKSKILKFDLE